MKRLLPLLIIPLIALTACKGKAKAAETEESPSADIPAFCEDSAYAYCAAQCDFGPRTMNSAAHDSCANWIAATFKRMGCAVSTQKADIKAWDGKTLHATNIIASINPNTPQRIILCAHWDSRPWADNDPDKANHDKPVMAANDGASGVAVLIEIARQLQAKPLVPVGIDLVCFDAEDYGTDNDENSWALGAAHFAKQMKPATYAYGILLDMVGGQNAKFYQEGFSLKYAQNIVSWLWTAAQQAGYSTYFPMQGGGYITDDHKYLNEAGVPTVDIIPYYPDCQQSCFGPTWHTVSDDMQHIDKQTLKAVGQTLMQHLYSAY